MATAERVFWETVVVLGFMALLAASWFLSGQRAERRQERAARESHATAEVVAQEHTDALAALRETCEDWAALQTNSEAKAAFRAFSAGIQPAAAARWGRFLNATKTELLNQPNVVFVHLMTPSGRVLMSSDEDYTKSGRVDDRADWARTTERLETRSQGEGAMLEMAAPVLDGDQPIAYLWLGYDIAAAKEALRPEALPAE
ncbi:MAG: hypothetical protein OES47_00815 [Acidobacteriota bacterium]|nr:hypothetical protein [Acidobacteriota bacterium]